MKIGLEHLDTDGLESFRGRRVWLSCNALEFEIMVVFCKMSENCTTLCACGTKHYEDLAMGICNYHYLGLRKRFDSFAHRFEVGKDVYSQEAVMHK